MEFANDVTKTTFLITFVIANFRFESVSANLGDAKNVNHRFMLNSDLKYLLKTLIKTFLRFYHTSKSHPFSQSNQFLIYWWVV